MPGIDVKMVSYGERLPGSHDRYNSEDSLEDNQSTTSSTESRQSDFQRKASDQEFIPTRTSGIMASKPAANPGQFTRINSNPLLISAQKQLLQVEEAKRKKKEQERKQIIGDDTPDWQSNLDGWKSRRRKQSEDAIERLTEMKRFGDDDGANGNRKSSISRKISAQCDLGDEIDFSELGLDNGEDEMSDNNTSSNGDPGEVVTRSPVVSNGGVKPVTRRESRGVSQEKVIPEEDEEEAEEIRVTREAGNTNGGGPYDSAIQGYKSFAKSALNNGSSSDSNPVTSERSSPASSLSHSASTSSMSPAPSSSSSSRPPVEKSDTTVEAWEEKIETFVQPARRVSAEISNKMKEKLANFEESKTDKEQTPVRLIEPDNSFRDKLKAFKTIESVASESREAPSGTLGTKPTRRESEPSLGLANAKPKGMPSYRSTSSSFMNTFQNNKFFQQNSLGSEKEDDSLSSSNHQMLDDALEESFNDILEDNDILDPDSGVVFSADDFVPLTGTMAPPQEKPPPLPAAPPPGADLSDQQKSSQMENEIDKQEREIIESLEREEKEHKKYLASSPSGVQTSSVARTVASQSQSDLRPPVMTSSTGTQSGGHHQAPGVWRKAESMSQLTNAKPAAPAPAPTEQPRKREKGEAGGNKDYNKHWLIQEAEQRRISEAKQRQTLEPNMEKMENINNNIGPEYPGGKRAQNNVSDNIYANVDVGSMNINTNYSSGGGGSVSVTNGQEGPGPQVPPRIGGQGTGGQDRVLSVSGKKKCSHCKEELGRGAAMIIESLRLFYHIRCFKCCVCSIQLGNGETGTDVRVRNNRLHCQNCYSNDEGLKFSKV